MPMPRTLPTHPDDLVDGCDYEVATQTHPSDVCDVYIGRFVELGVLRGVLCVVIIEPVDTKIKRWIPWSVITHIRRR